MRKATICLSIVSMLLMAGTHGARAQKFYASTMPAVYEDATSYPFLFQKGAGEYDDPIKLGKIDANDPTAYMVCGANCGDAYYGFVAKWDYAANKGTINKFVKVDWASGKVESQFEYNLFVKPKNFQHLAYNFSNNTLYGIATETVGDEEHSVLYNIVIDIDPYYGDVTPVPYKVKDLGKLYYGFDFGYNGKMYAICHTTGKDYYGNDATVWGLDVLDKDQNLESSVAIENSWGSNLTDYGYGMYNQFSLEFDHLSGKLYYTQTDCGSQQYIYELDPETHICSGGLMLGQNDDYSDFNANNLYIPFTAPDGGALSANVVTNLTVEADASGALRNTLKWTNPSINFVKEPLTELYSVRIYRDKAADANLLDEVTGLEPGAESTYVDENATQGINRYVLVPCRVQNEKGLASEAENWVGYDVPCAVNIVELSQEGGGIKVNWWKPAVSAHGGPMDIASLRYDVVRMPDEVVVAEATPDTCIIDMNPLPEWQNYSYNITPSTDAGKGETNDGYARIFTGPALTVPYDYSFDNDQKNNIWIYTNALDNWFNGYMDSWSGMFYYGGIYWNDNETQLKLDDWLLSPSIEMAPGKYRVTVEGYSHKAGYESEYNLYMGSGQSVAAQTTKLGTVTSTSAVDEEYKDFVYEFDVTEAGYYNFGVESTGPRYNGNDLPDYQDAGRGISNFKIELIGAAKPDTRDIYVGDCTDERANIYNGLTPVDTYSPSDGELIYNADMLPLRKGDQITKVKFLGYNATGDVVTTNFKAYMAPTTEQYFDNPTLREDGYSWEYATKFDETKMTELCNANITIPEGGEFDDDGNFINETAIPLIEMQLPEPLTYDGNGLAFKFSNDLIQVKDEKYSKVGFLSMQEEWGTNTTQSISKRSYWYDYYSSCGYWPFMVLEVIPAETQDFNALGSVVDEDGNPVAGATVVVVSGPDQFEGTTLDDGTYAIAAKGVREEMSVKAEMVGDDNLLPVSAKFTLGENPDVSISPLVLPFYRFQAVGMVRLADWTPLQGVTVTFTDEEGNVETCTTGEDGWYETKLRGRKAKFTVNAELAGYEPYEGEFEFDAENAWGDMYNVDDIVLNLLSGISGQGLDMNRDLKVYDLQGRYITTVKPAQKLNLQKGIYIINGVKTVIK